MKLQDFATKALTKAGIFRLNTDSDHQILLEYPVQPQPRYGYGKPPHKLLYQVFAQNRATYEKYLQSFLSFQADFAKIPVAKNPENQQELVWCNGWLGELDAVALYALTCQLNPKTYWEIGSGYSTKFVHRAINDHQLQTKIISLDPQPRAEINAISDEIIRFPLEAADLNVFDQVRAGDIVFFDGSHRCFTNSDVTVFFLEIFPNLPKGVFVQVHDICIPYDYPSEWNDRFYSEQYVLAALILGGCKFFDVILPNQFIAHEPDLVNILSPVWEQLKLTERVHLSKSFWMRTK